MNLADFISNATRPLVLDGAMGTQLAAAGLEMGGPTNLTHPEAVLSIHQRYIQAGADLLITNTLTMNRVMLVHTPGVDVRKVNLEGARLALAARREGTYVLGDMSATGKVLAPYGDLTEEVAYAAFLEQAGILAEGGVDGFIIETMFDLRETLVALKACKAAASLPVLVTLSFNPGRKGARTIMGNSPQECARALAEAGADAVGANCGGLAIADYAPVAAEMHAACELPVVIQPNAGQPAVKGGQASYNLEPQEFAGGIARCLEAGARLVGGCCGTGPAYIQAVTDMLKKR